MQSFDDITSPEFYDCFSSPKPLITPSKLFMNDCADEKAIDWTILENCNPNLAETPKSVRSSADSKRIRKSLIPIFSPSLPEKQPSGILSASGSRGSKSRRISKEMTEALATRASSSGRKSSIDKDAVLRELNQKQALEILELKEKLATLEMENQAKEVSMDALRVKLAHQEALCAGLQEEMTAVRFFAQVQGQKIEEQESMLMTSKMDHHEELSAKNRKYKTMIKKLQADRANYESGAATVIKQLNDQMAQLQKFALTRIETLEKQLLESRRITEDLTKENADLKAVTTEQERVLQEYQQAAAIAAANAASAAAENAKSCETQMLQPSTPVMIHHNTATTNNKTRSGARSVSPMATARAHLQHLTSAHQQQEKFRKEKAALQALQPTENDNQSNNNSDEEEQEEETTGSTASSTTNTPIAIAASMTLSYDATARNSSGNNALYFSPTSTIGSNGQLIVEHNEEMMHSFDFDDFASEDAMIITSPVATNNHHNQHGRRMTLSQSALATLSASSPTSDEK